ncbi:MAG: adenylate kinase family protein [archaeon]
MIRRIIITGTPGVGKTTIGKAFAKKHNLPFVSVGSLVEGKRFTLKWLQKKLMNFEGVLESHLLCEFYLPDSFVFILRCSPKVLAKRLAKRGYSKKKILENLECEALDYCTICAEINYGKVFEIDCTKKSIRKIIEIMEKALEGKAESEKVDFSKVLEDYPKFLKNVFSLCGDLSKRKPKKQRRIKTPTIS